MKNSLIHSQRTGTSRGPQRPRKLLAQLALFTLLGTLLIAPVASATGSDTSALVAEAQKRAAELQASGQPVAEISPSGSSSRILFFALLATGFLIFAGVVGANDQPSPRRQ